MLVATSFVTTAASARTPAEVRATDACTAQLPLPVTAPRRSLFHLDAAGAGSTTARFGDATGPDQSLPAAALLAACARMRARSPEERAVLFQELLPVIAADADSEAKRQRKTRPRSGRRVTPLLAFGVVAAIIVAVWLAVSGHP